MIEHSPERHSDLMIFRYIVNRIEGRIAEMVVNIVTIVQVRIHHRSINPYCINSIARRWHKDKREASGTGHKRIITWNSRSVFS